MIHQSAAIEAFLVGGGTLRTRVRERSTGDVHDLLASPFAIPRVSGRPQDMVAVLEALEQKGVVVRSEAVHAYDSTEYRVTWRIAERR